MRIHPLGLSQAALIEGERAEDERGWFSRIFSVEDAAAAGWDPAVSQCSFSFNIAPGTLRGLHLQQWPHEESKLVVCTAGAIFDVVVDVSETSETFGRWAAVELRAGRPEAVFVPKGLAHGYLTLEPESMVYYQISTPYAPESAVGYRWDDPTFGISWPSPVAVISERDANFPLLGG